MSFPLSIDLSTFILTIPILLFGFAVLTPLVFYKKLPRWVLVVLLFVLLINLAFVGFGFGGFAGVFGLVLYPVIFILALQEKRLGKNPYWKMVIQIIKYGILLVVIAFLVFFIWHAPSART